MPTAQYLHFYLFFLPFIVSEFRSWKTQEELLNPPMGPWSFLSVISLTLLQFTIQVSRDNYGNNLIKNICFARITITKNPKCHSAAGL